MKTKVRKHYCRKGRCPDCNVATGSMHSLNCEYAYKRMPPKTKGRVDNKFQPWERNCFDVLK